MADTTHRIVSPGTLLKEKREAQGISLEEASRITRIGKNYLDALEKDSYERLPNPAYARGFLRSYAQFLNIDPDDATALLDAAPAVDEAEPRAAALPAEGRREQRQRSNWLTVAGLLAAVAGAYFLGQRDQQVTERPPVAPVIPVQQRLSTGAAPKEGAQQAAAPDADEAAPSRPADGAVLKVKANADCRMVVNIDDEISQVYELKAGDLIEWRGENFFAIELSNAAGIEAELDGRPLKLGAGASRVVVTTDGTVKH